MRQEEPEARGQLLSTPWWRWAVAALASTCVILVALLLLEQGDTGWVDVSSSDSGTVDENPRRHEISTTNPNSSVSPDSAASGLLLPPADALSAPQVVTIVDPWGAAVPTARLIHFGKETVAEFAKQPTSLGAGRWLLNGEKQGQLSASAPGWGEATWDFPADRHDPSSDDNPQAAGTMAITLVLGNDVSHWGQLVDTEQQPLAGERITLQFPSGLALHTWSQAPLTVFARHPTAFRRKILGPSNHVVVVTSCDGRFPCPAEPGQLLVAAPGGELPSDRGRLPASRFSQLDIKSRKPLQLVGTALLPYELVLLDPHGQPFTGPANIELTLDPADQPDEDVADYESDLATIDEPPTRRLLMLTVDAEGKGRFDLAKTGRFMLSAHVGGMTAGPLSVAADGTDPTPSVTLQLRAAQWITGRVVDESGLPLAGAWISLRTSEHWPRRSAWSSGGYSFQASSWPLVDRPFDRRQTLPEPPLGSDVLLSASDGSFRLASGSGCLLVQHPAFDAIRLPPRLLGNDMTVVLEHGTTIAGRVLLDGQPPSALGQLSVRVSARGLLSALVIGEHVTNTDAEGRFVLTALPPGMTTLTVNRGGTVLLDRPVGLVHGRTRNLELNIASWHPIEITLNDTCGRVDELTLLPGERVIALINKPVLRQVAKRVSLDPDEEGRWQGAVSWTGDTVVLCSLYGLADIELGRVHITNDTVQYSVALPSASLHVSVRATAQAFPVSIEVSHLGRVPEIIAFGNLTQDDPTHTLNNLPPGDYMVFSPSHSQLTPRIVMISARSDDLFVQLMDDNRLLRCVITTAQGEPAANVSVETLLGGRTVQTVTTDQNGEAQLLLPLQPDRPLAIRILDDRRPHLKLSAVPNGTMLIPVPDGLMGPLEITLPRRPGP